MSVLEIARMGHPALRSVAEAVTDPTDPVVSALITDMIETMRAMEGIGLAAPQIAVPKRVLIFELPAGPMEEDKVPEMVLTTLINPVIEPIGDVIEEGWEGCLSLPGMAGLVPRYLEVRYRGVTQKGETVEQEVSGFRARVVQHEVDHLDGILYPMRIKDLSNLGYIDEMQKTLPEL